MAGGARTSLGITGLRIPPTGGGGIISPGAGFPVTGYPATLFAWAFSQLQSSATYHRVMSLGTGLAATTNQLSLARAAGGLYAMSAAAGAQTTTDESAFGGASKSGRWVAVAASFASATDRTLYVDGRVAATNTTSRVPAGITTLSVGITNTGTLLFEGMIVLPSVWSVALTPNEHRALAMGAMPWSIRSGRLAACYRDLAEGRDMIGRQDLTPYASDAKIHACASLPPQLLVKARAQRKYFLVDSSFTATWAASGGLVLGGSASVSLLRAFKAAWARGSNAVYY